MYNDRHGVISKTKTNTHSMNDKIGKGYLVWK